MKIWGNKEKRKIRIKEMYATACAKAEFLMTSDAECKTVMVAGICGKSKHANVAEELAISYSEINNNKVLLLDYDMQSASIDNELSKTVTSEITNHVNINTNRTEVMVCEISPNYHVAPMALHYSKSNRILASAGFLNQLGLNELESRYDHIVINVSAFYDITDAVGLLKKPDGVIISLALHKSRNKEIRKVVELMNLRGIRILGAIITK